MIFFNRVIALALSLILMVASAFAADACPELTGLQKAAGYVSSYLDFTHFVWLLGIAVVFGGACLFFSGIFMALINIFFKYLLEASLWILSVGLVAGTALMPESYKSTTLVLGSLLLPLAMTCTAALHKIRPNYKMFSLTLTVMWSIIAMVNSSSTVGFLAVGALISLLGFVMVVGPLCYGFGFEDDAAIWRGTFSAFLIAALYTVVRSTGLNIGILSVFEAGALWLASFVCFVGLLITSNRWYWESKRGGSNYIMMNIIAIVVLTGFIGSGILYGVREITIMATTFLIFWMAGKIIEVPSHGKIALGVKMLVAGGMIIGFYTWLISHPELAQYYMVAK